MKSSATTPPTHLLTLRPLQVSVRPTPHAQQNRAGDHRQRHAERHDGSSSSEAPHLILYSSTPRAGRCSGHQCQHGASLETQKWVTPAQLVRVRRALPHAVCSGVCKARLVMLKEPKMPTGRHVASDVPFTEGFEVWFDRVAGRSQCHLHAASLGINPNMSSVLFDRDKKSFCGFLRDDRGRAARLLPAALGEAAVVVCVRRRCWDWQMEGAARIGLSGGRRRATAAGLCWGVSSVAMCARRRCVDDAYLAWAGFTGGLNVTNLCEGVRRPALCLRSLVLGGDK